MTRPAAAAPALLAAALALAPLPATPGAGTGAGAGTETTAAADLGLAALAHRLHRAGQARADALALLVAGRLRRAAGIADWEGLFVEAAVAAAGNPALAALIADALAEAPRGLVAGPRTTWAEIGPGETHAYPGLVFAGGALAEVYVEGDGGTALEVEVEGPDGPVCHRTGAGDIAYCAWRPALTQPVTVRVRNAGPAPNRYLLMTN
ncbi:MAG: hypothetical protein IT545_12445 [Rhodobacteraceae bacterium]|nr:hypothetical protein [Paracoccaceae bacterium]